MARKYAVRLVDKRQTYYVYDIESDANILGFAYATEYGRGIAYSNAVINCNELNEQKLNDNKSNSA
jgi:hypothetical protein